MLLLDWPAPYASVGDNNNDNSGGSDHDLGDCQTPLTGELCYCFFTGYQFAYSDTWTIIVLPVLLCFSVGSLLMWQVI
jgi:hypothetical protein